MSTSSVRSPLAAHTQDAQGWGKAGAGKACDAVGNKVQQQYRRKSSAAQWKVAFMLWEVAWTTLFVCGWLACCLMLQPAQWCYFFLFGATLEAELPAAVVCMCLPTSSVRGGSSHQHHA
jgi:hypothetical protein